MSGTVAWLFAFVIFALAAVIFALLTDGFATKRAIMREFGSRVRLATPPKAETPKNPDEDVPMTSAGTPSSGEAS